MPETLTQQDKMQNELVIQSQRADRAEQDARLLREQLRDLRDEIARLRQTIQQHEATLLDVTSVIQRGRARALASRARPANLERVGEAGKYPVLNPE